MKNIVKLFASRPVTVCMLICICFLAGISAASKLPIRKLPLISVPRVIVEASMPGFAANEMRNMVAIPLEDAYASLKGLMRSSSISRDGLVTLQLDFSWGQNQIHAASMVREITDTAYQSLPQAMIKPTVTLYQSDTEPIIIAGVKSKNANMSLARKISEYEIVTSLRRIDEVASINIIGGCDREIVVSVDLEKAAARELCITDIASAIADECADLPLGSVYDGDTELIAVSRGMARSQYELARYSGITRNGIFTLSELAEVEERDKEIKSFFVSNGHAMVGIEVFIKSDADPILSAKKIRAELDSLTLAFCNDVDIAVVEDNSILISKSINELAIAAIIASISVVIALFMFLRDLRAGILIALSLPVSIAITFFILMVFGRSINSMSLGGIGLAIGMISDNGVVVYDVLTSYFSKHKYKPNASEIANAVGTVLSGSFGSMITTVIVFIPILFLPGAIGALFGDLSLGIICTSISGWLIAVFLLPSAYRFFWKPSDKHKTQNRDSMKLELIYRKALAIVFRHPIYSSMLTIIIAIIGISMAITRPLSFMPKDSSDTVIVQVKFAGGTRLDYMKKIAESFSSQLIMGKIVSVYAWAGAEDNDILRRASLDYDADTVLFICKILTKDKVSDVISHINKKARGFFPSNVSFSVYEHSDASAKILGFDDKIRIAVRADTQDKAKELSESLKLKLKNCIVIDDVSMEIFPNGMSPRLVLYPQRESAANIQISLYDMAKVMNTATEGVIAGSIQKDGRLMDVRVIANSFGLQDESKNIDMLSSVPVVARHAEIIPIGSVAKFNLHDECSALTRLDRSDVFYVDIKNDVKHNALVNETVGQIIANVNNISRADESAFRMYGKLMFTTIMLVVIILYLTLAAQFESFIIPIFIMTAIPFALAGVGPFLFFSKFGLDSGSILGIVVLFGLVVNNSILLYEARCNKMQLGVPAAPASLFGASDRVRPVITTTVTTIVALIPIFIAQSGAAQKSMSIAMLGGIIASTGISLFIAPLLFCLYKKY